jgi:hypothetical protein
MNIRNIKPNLDWVHNNNNKMSNYGKHTSLNNQRDQGKENITNISQL